MKSIFKKIIIKILILESRIILKKYKPKIIAVTGSVGKTSTKDAIFTAMSSSDHIRKSEKSFNSEIGVPLTILGLQNGWNDPVIWLKNIFEGIELIIFKSEYPKTLILEIGADHPGDIKSISKWLRADIVVITKIGEVPVHVEFFPSPEALVKEKSYLLNSLKKDGTLILLADDVRVREMAKDMKQKVILYGFSNDASIIATDISVIYNNSLPEGMTFKLNYQGNSVPISLKNVLGNQQVYPIIAATAVAIASDISLSKIVTSFESHNPPHGRMNLIKGINGSVIIDDTYNSSPDALREGLLTLASLNSTGRKIAVLGDMLELGSFSAEEHKKAGVIAMQSCNILITVGQRAKLMGKNSISFDSSDEAGEYLKTIAVAGDIFFIKGSQSIRMEKITKALMAEPDKASELLVRQEEEWLNRK